jgi:hypothetical protein
VPELHAPEVVAARATLSVHVEPAGDGVRAVTAAS